MASKKEKKAGPPRPFIIRSPDYRRFYVTGAIGNFSPFDYRLTFYTHEEEWPEKPTQTTSLPVSQVMQVTLVMSPDLMKRLRDMLDRHLKKKEKTPEPKPEVEIA